MTCEQFDDRLDAWLQGRLTRNDRTAIEAHMASCAACRAMAADVRLLQREARLIGEEGPPAGAWERLAAHLEPQMAPRRAPATTGVPRRVSWQGLAIAATLCLVIGASLIGLRHSLFTGVPDRPADGTDDSPAALVQSIEFELEQAAEHYERAIAGLEQVASDTDSPLDPAMTAMLRENLSIIDQAIDDSRVALRTEPTSRFAQEHLFDAFRRKVALLQDTIALMNEMRKGNQAGATEIASGFNKG